MDKYEYQTEIGIRVWVHDAQTKEFIKLVDLDADDVIKSSVGPDIQWKIEDYVEDIYHNPEILDL